MHQGLPACIQGRALAAGLHLLEARDSWYQVSPPQATCLVLSQFQSADIQAQQPRILWGGSCQHPCRHSFEASVSTTRLSHSPVPRG